MTQLPPEPLVPSNTLTTAMPGGGKGLGHHPLASHSIHATQKEPEALKSGCAQYAHDPNRLIAANHVVAVEFAPIAAANNYWR
jgi:Hexameric tyrosine-coordinated heme protein (HTHP)